MKRSNLNKVIKLIIITPQYYKTIFIKQNITFVHRLSCYLMYFTLGSSIYQFFSYILLQALLYFPEYVLHHILLFCWYELWSQCHLSNSPAAFKCHVLKTIIEQVIQLFVHLPQPVSVLPGLLFTNTIFTLHHFFFCKGSILVSLEY